MKIINSNQREQPTDILFTEEGIIKNKKEETEQNCLRVFGRKEVGGSITVSYRLLTDEQRSKNRENFQKAKERNSCLFSSTVQEDIQRFFDKQSEQNK